MKPLGTLHFADWAVAVCYANSMARRSRVRFRVHKFNHSRHGLCWRVEVA